MARGNTSTPTRSTPRETTRSDDRRQPSTDMIEYLREYAREKPEVAALWCFGIGFVMGWKLKIW